MVNYEKPQGGQMEGKVLFCQMKVDRALNRKVLYWSFVYGQSYRIHRRGKTAKGTVDAAEKDGQ